MDFGEWDALSMTEAPDHLNNRAGGAFTVADSQVQSAFSISLCGHGAAPAK